MQAVMLDVDALGPRPDLSPIENAVDTLTLYDATTPDQIIERCKDASVIIPNKVIISRDIIKALPNLKLICSVGTGTDHIDSDAAREHGVEVRNVKAFGSAGIAQHTMMMILGLAGNLLPYRHALADEQAWSPDVTFTERLRMTRQMAGKNLTIVGAGNIGQEVARVAEAFGMNVRFSRRVDDPEDRQPTLESLLPDTDVLSLHCPLTPYTQNIIDQKALEALPEHAYVINCARGSVMDNAAALAALKANRIGGLAVDTLEQEPPPADHPFIKALAEDRYNLIITPHSAWASFEARDAIINGIANNIRTFTF